MLGLKILERKKKIFEATTENLLNFPSFLWELPLQKEFIFWLLEQYTMQVDVQTNMLIKNLEIFMSRLSSQTEKRMDFYKCVFLQ